MSCPSQFRRWFVVSVMAFVVLGGLAHGAHCHTDGSPIHATCVVCSFQHSTATQIAPLGIVGDARSLGGVAPCDANVSVSSQILPVDSPRAPPFLIV